MEVKPIDGLDGLPKSKLFITYCNGKTVEFGAELTPTEVKNEPTLDWSADPNKYYCLIMYDPDAPCRDNPIYADVKHWIVVNILGSDVRSGDVIIQYKGSGAPKGTGLHRYIFVIFEQCEKMILDEEDKRTETRLNWSFANFRKKHKFETVFAGNYFQAQWDPYVDEMKKKNSKMMKNIVFC